MQVLRFLKFAVSPRYLDVYFDFVFQTHNMPEKQYIFRREQIQGYG